MKKSVLAFLLTICTILTTQVQADCYDYNQGWYVNGLGGANFVNHYGLDHVKVERKTGYLVGGALGYKFLTTTPIGCRLEGEIAYRQNEFDRAKIHGQKVDLSGHTKLMTYMVNGYIDLSLNFTPITPYIGAGFGYGDIWGKVKGNDEKTKTSSHGFVYQWMVGASYPICDQVDLGIEYRYLSGRKHTTDHSVCLSLKRFF